MNNTCSPNPMKIPLTLLLIIGFGPLQAQLWQDRYSDALELAKTQDRPLVVVFSGSDWCGPCIRMKKQVLDSGEFTDHAGENYVLYNADFPKKKQNQLPLELSETNRSLADRYNPEGYFPLIVVLDKDENLLGKTGYYPRFGPRKYIDLLNGFIK